MVNSITYAIEHTKFSYTKRCAFRFAVAKKRLDVMPITDGRLYEHIPEEHLHENESRDDVMNRAVAFFEAMHKEHFVEDDVVEVLPPHFWVVQN